MFDLTEELEMIRNTARDYARANLVKRAEMYDKKEEFPWENYKEIGELGFLGILVPEEFGGIGLGSLALMLVVEEIAYACASTAITLAVHNSLVCNPIVKYGTQEQKSKYLPSLASGEKLGAFCLTEPDFGSDAANIKTTAELKGGKYILNGTKSWISTGSVAGVLIVFARTGKNAPKPSMGLSAFIVEPSFKGFVVGKNEKKMGLRASKTVQLTFDNMEVPAENLLGKPGEGYEIALRFLSSSRIGVGAQSVGIAKACLDESIKYSKERRQFGRPICDFQAIQVKLAEMEAEIQASRLLVHKAACMCDKNLPYTKEAAIAKMFASETCNRAAAEAVQIHGGYGYIKEYLVERLFRDAKVTEIYEGTNEIQRIVIAKQLLKE